MANHGRSVDTNIALDAFGGAYYNPLISNGNMGSYIGRIVIELWEKPNQKLTIANSALDVDPATWSDATQLAMMAAAVNGDEASLLERVAIALPDRVSDAKPDPLIGFHGQSAISSGGSDKSYVGRVMVELWAAPGKSDAQLLTYSADAVNGDHMTLLERVIAALPVRIAKVNKGRAFQR